MYKCLRLGQLGKCPPLRGKLLARPTPVFCWIRFKMIKSCSVFCLLIKKFFSKCSKVVLTRVHRSPPARSPPRPLHQLSGGNSWPGGRWEERKLKEGRGNHSPSEVWQQAEGCPPQSQPGPGHGGLPHTCAAWTSTSSLSWSKYERTCCHWRRQWWGKLEHRAVDIIAHESCSPPSWLMMQIKMLFGKEFTDRAKSDLSPDQGACFAELWQQRHTRRTPSTWRWVRCKAVRGFGTNHGAKKSMKTPALLSLKWFICSICYFNCPSLMII